MFLTLNDPEGSPIKFKISKFPDGQQTVDVTPWDVQRYSSNIIQINSRLTSFKDLELIICANQALKNNGAEKISLYVPYFLGARSDRKFQEGGVNYLKQVICPIINSQNFHSVHVLDPHSDVLEACLNNYHKEDNHLLVDDALSYLIKDGEEDSVVFVSPDAGAYKKIFDVAKKFGIRNIITATKVRDIVTGNIIRTEVPDLEEMEGKMFVIIDDICDGGRTFVELAAEIRNHTHNAKIYLVVTHGIFSNWYEDLRPVIDQIFTTNSVKDIIGVPGTPNDEPYVNQLKVI
jgi:ribose-phosphate pyrophosphokinase